MSAKYESYRDLERAEAWGRDYDIICRPGQSGVVIMAPHGGGIEPGTAEIARALAGSRHGFYCFRGLKAAGNSELRLPSHRFDEPCGLALAAAAVTVVTVHGCREASTVVYLGGRDTVLKRRAWESLAAAGLNVDEHRRFGGLHAANICNRGRTGRGLQIELSAGLRPGVADGQPAPAIAKLSRCLLTAMARVLD